MKHKLPQDIPLISFYSEASISPGVVAKMTQMLMLNFPVYPSQALGLRSDICDQTGHQVPVVIPASAAMAVCALHLKLRYGENGNGLVTFRDAQVPGSLVIRADRKLDHALMVYSSNKRNPKEPDASEMYEALLTLLVELGNTKKKRDSTLIFTSCFMIWAHLVYQD